MSSAARNDQIYESDLAEVGVFFSLWAENGQSPALVSGKHSSTRGSQPAGYWEWHSIESHE